MIDLHELKVYEVNCGEAGNEYITNDLLLTILDDDLTKIGNREATFHQLYAVVNEKTKKNIFVVNIQANLIIKFSLFAVVLLFFSV